MAGHGDTAAGGSGAVRVAGAMKPITIVGVDCAAQPEDTGLARTTWDGETLIVQETCCASRRTSAALIVAGWIKQSDRTLLALDAPLGWPAELGRTLALHRAGAALKPSAHAMFRRLTDDEIYRRFRKRPLEVAADRIARAAHAALKFLEDLRALVDDPIPLLWSAEWAGPCAAIEVYPAATRIALAVPRGSGSLVGLESRMRIATDVPPDSEHSRDAIVCAITAVEFLAGRTTAPTPDQQVQALHEGWIWAGHTPPAEPAPSEEAPTADLAEGPPISLQSAPDLQARRGADAIR
jgi:predicted nuclease with RNAse H fold